MITRVVQVDLKPESQGGDDWQSNANKNTSVTTAGGGLASPQIYFPLFSFSVHAKSAGSPDKDPKTVSNPGSFPGLPQRWLSALARAQTRPLHNGNARARHTDESAGCSLSCWFASLAAAIQSILLTRWRRFHASGRIASAITANYAAVSFLLYCRTPCSIACSVQMELF